MDPRFNREVDLETGFHTRCLICMPIKDGAGNVLAVAQAINKQIDEDANSDDKKDDGCDEDASKSVFSARDVSVFRAYTSFCGIGLHQAQILWRSQLETRRSQVLLELARLIFSDQSDVRRLIYTILMHSQSLLTCQRCQFLLVNNLTEDTPDSDVFGEAYDYTWKDGDLDFDEVDCKDPVWKSRSILCMPIKHSDGHVLGVCQLVNKSSLSCHCSLPQESLPVSSLEFEDSWSGAFSKNDESLFEAFALFAGLGIANTQMYEQVLRAEAKQRIAFDVLSYHATATPAEASALAKELIPSAKYYRLNQFSFTDLPLSVDDTLKACIRMFSDMGFISRFRIDYNSLCRWLLSVKKNYRAVTYHNWRHAFNVAQTMFVMFKVSPC
ncbi:unnamed protein product [Mesocestoides corti]|uniref:PDEase domain-containing protein n=1 Tax=Mesocestoides corti TaxID=53468 RepID=A0A158QVY5_MESCO|nr:unnamed protein product [Mesocestoides corti]